MFPVWHDPAAGEEVKALVPLRLYQPEGQLIHRVIESLIPKAYVFRVIPVAAIIDILDPGPQTAPRHVGQGSEVV